MDLETRMASVLAAWLALGAGVAQGAPTFFTVVGAQGEAIAGARIHAVGGSPHVPQELWPTEAQTAVSDARGRAVMRLSPDLCHVAWAVGGKDERLSPTVGYFAAGAMVQLHCLDVAVARSIPVMGTEAWPDAGPLTFHAMTPSPIFEVLLVRAGDRVMVPAGPFSVIEARSRDGQVLVHASAAVDELRVPPPQRLRVRVLDAKGDPRAGARVRLRVGRVSGWRVDGLGGVVEDRWRVLGTTDAEGRAEVLVPYDADPFVETSHGNLLLFADAAGLAEVAGGIWNRRPYVDDRRAESFGDHELTFHLQRTEPLRGVLVGAAPGTRLHLAGVCKLHTDRNSYTHDARSFVAEVAADGNFVFDDVPAELHTTRVTAVPRSRDGEFGWFPALMGRVLPDQLQVGAGASRPTLAAPVRFVVRDPVGGPARGGVLLVAASQQRGVLFREAVFRVPLDPAGAASLRLLPGNWVVGAMSDDGFVAREIVVAADADVGLSHDLEMAPMLRMRIELLDKDGSPLDGARVRLRGTTTRGVADPVQVLRQSVRTSQRSTWDTLRTDAQGRVAIPFLPVDGVVQRVSLRHERGETGEFALEDTGDWQRMHLR
jgi:hypothetical protein